VYGFVAALLGLSAVAAIQSSSDLQAASPQAEGHRAHMSWVVQSFLTQNAGATSNGSSAPTMHVIVNGPPDVMDRVEQQYGLRRVGSLDSGAVFLATADQIDSVSGDPQVSNVAEDGVVLASMNVTTQSTGASQVWTSKRFGPYTGKGVTIAVIDSGRGTHPDLTGRFVFEKDFTGKGTGDAYGHGTHIEGIIAGSGKASGVTPGYGGMAPDAKLVSLRVLDETGAGGESQVIAAIEWCIKNQARFNLRVVNLSLGRLPTQSFEDDPMALAV
jgi:subtilisin family serine protease